MLCLAWLSSCFRSPALGFSSILCGSVAEPWNHPPRVLTQTLNSLHRPCVPDIDSCIRHLTEWSIYSVYQMLQKSSCSPDRYRSGESVRIPHIQAWPGRLPPNMRPHSPKNQITQAKRNGENIQGKVGKGVDRGRGHRASFKGNVHHRMFTAHCTFWGGSRNGKTHIYQFPTGNSRSGTWIQNTKESRSHYPEIG